ncbi:MAG: bifunctional UDP-N-acetylmuramoyl-tripeptide:D-alanyl-D-alanine ligase/alanine racemase [Bacteroidota bacterium]
MYSLSQIAEISGAQFKGKVNHLIQHYLIDSRNVQSLDNTLFVALITNRNNGHQYIESLIDLGIKAFLVQDKAFDFEKYIEQNVSFLVSEDPLKAIQKLAAHHRQQFDIPVIGITGSNGKTVVKEWLYQLLKPNYLICRSPKSYNSQIGVPLSVLNLNHRHTLAIFEAGISTTNEMDNLAEIIQPSIGILTSLGSAHAEGFPNQKYKLNEKLKLCNKAKTVIINGVDAEDLERKNNYVVISENPGQDYRLITKDFGFDLVNQQQSYHFSIPFNDRASHYNAATCVLCMLQLGFSESDIRDRLITLQAVALRLEIKTGINHCILINDYYNSDLDSIKIALGFMQQQNRGLQKMVIVSDIEQSGLESGMLYNQLAELLNQNQIDKVIGIGMEISKHKYLFNNKALFFQSTQAFEKAFLLNQYLFSNACILLKGARSFGFENISQLLQLKSHDTVFEINLNKLIDNVNYYKGLVHPEVQLMCMVKAMGYGSGSVEIARTLQHRGVNYLAVAYADEGVELRKANVQLPIMVMNPEADAFDDIIQYQLEPELYSFKVLQAFIHRLDGLGISEAYPVHLKLDTGMHRLGFETNDLEQLIDLLKSAHQIKVKSVFSHLVGSDNPLLDDFTQTQINRFKSAAEAIESAIGCAVIKHLCNSAGISRFKNAHFNMVRLGIGMYGIGAGEQEQKYLQNVSSLKTRISQIKTVHAGETVGYNRNALIDQTIRLATIPIGYADGFARSLGNAKHGVYIGGEFCKTIGNVCMDMCMVDVTAIICNEGDEVIIFENTGQINEMAKAMNTISYEVLTNVSGRVKRVYLQE